MLADQLNFTRHEDFSILSVSTHPDVGIRIKAMLRVIPEGKKWRIDRLDFTRKFALGSTISDLRFDSMDDGIVHAIEVLRETYSGLVPSLGASDPVVQEAFVNLSSE